jgi:transcriptional regulator of acetoin/glycerol metabolism
MSIGQDDFPVTRVPFHEQNHQLNELPPVIQKSLQRCWPRLHLEQEACIASDQLPQLLETNSYLLSIAKPIIDEIFQAMNGSNTAVALVDPSGYLLMLQGDPTILDYLSERAVVVGSDLSEYGAGTNAFGLALIESAAMQVVGSEHFLRKFQGVSDAAAPIFDNLFDLIGAIGVFGFIETMPSGSLALAISAARSIMEKNAAYQALEEKDYQVERFEQILSTIDDGVMAWNGNGDIIYLNPAGENILGMEKKKLLGRPFSEALNIPEEIFERIKSDKDVFELETAISVNRRPLACLLSVIDLPDGLGTCATFRLKKDIQKLVLREFSSKGFFGLKDILGTSTQMRQVRSQVKTAAQAKASVLITGELGTGKSLIAQVIHSLGDFKDGPFIVFQCASLPCEMIIPELMGNGPGSGKQNNWHTNKFELADGGVLYFQDINLLPLEGQNILLDFLKTGVTQNVQSNRRRTVQTRIIAASAASLDLLAAEGKFSAELLRWLGVFRITLPPLRERREDIAILAMSILERLSCRYQDQILLAPESLALMLAYDWPGNIRELEVTLERAVYSLGRDPIITPMQLPLSLHKPSVVVQKGTPPDRTQPFNQIQQEALLQAAKDCNGNVSEMARMLGIGRTTVWRWLKRMDISLENYRSSSPEIE